MAGSSTGQTSAPYIPAAWVLFSLHNDMSFSIGASKTNPSMHVLQRNPRYSGFLNKHSYHSCRLHQKSRRESKLHGGRNGTKQMISTHTLCTEGDAIIPKPRIAIIIFQPAPSAWRVTSKMLMPMVWLCGFQSTPSVRRAAGRHVR